MQTMIRAASIQCSNRPISAFRASSIAITRQTNPLPKKQTKQNMTHTHTPRPWDQLGCEIYAGEIPIAGIIGITWDRMVENQANLNLISAAPDMLEALQMLMPQEPREADSYDRAMWENARAAIAKATGKGDA